MKRTRRMIVSIFWVVLGAVLIICCHKGALDEFWSGMGVALVVVGALQLFRHIKYKTNEEYRESVDTREGDERNRYLANKAWAWAGYLFVLIAAVAAIVLKIMGYDQLVPVASGSVCLLVLLYWGAYTVLRRKY